MNMAKRSKLMKEYYNSPQHVVSKRVSAPLSKNLKEQYKTKSVRLRLNDVVKILRGEYKGVEGKVTHIYPHDGMISIEGVNREKLAGGNTPIKIDASNVVVNSLELKDNKRKAKLELVE